VVEIGAGLGSLTLALLETGASVTAVEVDRGIVPVLREVVEPAGAQVVEGDALTMDWRQVLGDEGGWVLVANLPYNVATPLVVSLLEEVPSIGRMLVMVQAEVGERMAARPREPAYGAVSVLVAYWADAAVIGRVPAAVFVPRPNVESALVAVARRSPAGEGVDYRRLKQVVRAGFAQRRKMLRRSLAGVVDPEAFGAAGIRPDARAEELGVQDWMRLAAWPS
jgi:16S rRNA (adenine1518-N6/adenine1519-N6)-dimethyltransferase